MRSRPLDPFHLAGLAHPAALAAVAALVVATGCAHAPTPAAPAAAAPRPPRTARFAIRNEFKLKIPAGTGKARIWIPLPQADPQSELPDFSASRVDNLKIDAPYPVAITRDSEGNSVGYLEAKAPPAGDLVITETFELSRDEILRGPFDPARTRPLDEAERARLARYLAASSHIPVGGSFADLAARVVGDEQNPLRASRLIYDWVLRNVDYWVKDPAHKKASPAGDAKFCLTTGGGNCSDFHSLYSSLARSRGIPTRMVYGGMMKQEVAGQNVDVSYHCWVETWLPQIGWLPLDASVADLFFADNLRTDLSPDEQKRLRLTAGSNYHGENARVVDYYFGNLDERRVVWTSERDLVLSPAPAGPPVNTMVKGYYELDDKVKEWSWDNSALTRTNTFTELAAPVGPAWPLE